jgi:hypothetical protein
MRWRSRRLAWCLALPGCAGAAAGPRDEPSCIEAERVVRREEGRASGRLAPSLLASGGVAVEVAAGETARFALPDGQGDRDSGKTRWWWRVARVGGADGAGEKGAKEDGRAAVGEVELDWCVASGRPPPTSRLSLPRAAHPECFDWRPLGPAPPGAIEVCLRCVDGDATLRVDAFARHDAGPDAIRSADQRLELRAAPGARVADPEWTLHLLRDAVAVARGRLGVEPVGTIVLFALPGGGREFADRGGFQNGNALFLRDDELHLPWRGYVHEVVHLIEEQQRLALPWSFSEGLACAVALEAALAEFSGIEGPRREAARLRSLAIEGDGWWRPGQHGCNPLLPWSPPSGAAAVDPSARSAAYDWATLLVRGAAERGGSRFYERLVAELLRTRPPAWQSAKESLASGPGATRRFLDALEAAAGAPLREWFATIGVLPRE